MQVTDELFASFDYDGDGKITINEFDANLKDKTRKAIEEKLKSGFVFDKEKWKAGAKPPTAGPVGMSVGRAFMQFDVDGNGSLDIDELKRGTQAHYLCKRASSAYCTRAIVLLARELCMKPPAAAYVAFAPVSLPPLPSLLPYINGG